MKTSFIRKWINNVIYNVKGKRGHYLITSTRLPQEWDSLRSFSVVIPFSTLDFNVLEQSIREAYKLRYLLSDLCASHYFQDDIYQTLFEKRKRGHAVSAMERDYFETTTNQYKQFVCEKIGLILLYEKTWEGLSIPEHNSICTFANKWPACQLVAFSNSDLEIDNARNHVRNYSNRVFFLEIGRLLTDKEIGGILSTMMS